MNFKNLFQKCAMRNFLPSPDSFMTCSLFCLINLLSSLFPILTLVSFFFYFLLLICSPFFSLHLLRYNFFFAFNITFEFGRHFCYSGGWIRYHFILKEIIFWIHHLGLIYVFFYNNICQIFVIKIFSRDKLWYILCPTPGWPSG